MTLIIGPGGAGLTFLSWSIIFLRGDVQYTTLNQKIINVDIDPLIGPVAHGFVKDHIYKTNDIVRLQKAHAKSVIYFVPTHQRDFDSIADIDCNKIVFDCQGHGPQVLARMITCMPYAGPLTVFDRLKPVYGENVVRGALLEFHRFYTNYYLVPDNPNFFRINYPDVFENLDQRIINLFEFLNLAINPCRLEQWLPIYAEYRNRNANIYNNYLQTTASTDSATKLKILKEVLHEQLVCTGTHE